MTFLGCVRWKGRAARCRVRGIMQCQKQDGFVCPVGWRATFTALRHRSVMRVCYCLRACQSHMSSISTLFRHFNNIKCDRIEHNVNRVSQFNVVINFVLSVLNRARTQIHPLNVIVILPGGNLMEIMDEVDFISGSWDTSKRISEIS